MKRFFQVFVFSLCLMALLSTSGFGASAEIENNATIAAFADRGFIVQEGVMATPNPIGLYESGITPSCYGNNPPSPYMQFKVP